MKRLILISIIVVMSIMSGCSGMTRTQQTTLSGGAIGAGAGAVFSSVVGGNAVTGAVVGGAAGAATGYFVGEQNKK